MIIFMFVCFCHLSETRPPNPSDVLTNQGTHLIHLTSAFCAASSQAALLQECGQTQGGKEVSPSTSNPHSPLTWGSWLFPWVQWSLWYASGMNMSSSRKGHVTCLMLLQCRSQLGEIKIQTLLPWTSCVNLLRIGRDGKLFLDTCRICRLVNLHPNHSAKMVPWCSSTISLQTASVKPGETGPSRNLCQLNPWDAITERHTRPNPAPWRVWTCFGRAASIWNGSKIRERELLEMPHP